MESMASVKPKPLLLSSSPPSKRSRTDDSAEEMDLISDLPDQLLHYILSFLDMIFVVRTSILSKRWRHVWKSLHILSFSEEVFNGQFTADPPTPEDSFFVTTQKEDLFMDFVNGVLVHLDAGNVATFSVSGIYSKWKNCALARFRRNDEECANRRILNLPLWFFTCKTLTTLKLDMGSKKGRTILKIPYLDPLSLPCLRTLHLESFFFVDGNNVSRFLSRCLVLETLVICNCLLREKSSLTISAPKLKNLEVSLSRPVKLHGAKDRVIVLAPKLTFFRCGDHLLREFCLDLQNVTSLVEADIDSHLAGSINDTIQVVEDYCQNVFKCLKDVSNVESLTISIHLLEDIHQTHPYFGIQIHPFRNLRILKVKTVFQKELIIIVTLLEACPHLETLVLQWAPGVIAEREYNFTSEYNHRVEMIEHIAEGGDPIDMLVKLIAEEEEQDWETKVPGQCLSYSLKFVEFRSFDGYLSEFEFLKYLLKNALVLVKIDIFSRELDSSECQRSTVAISRKLVELIQPSSNIEICFSSEYK